MSKQCGGPCHKWLPDEYFDKDETKADGLRTWCKKCRSKKAEHKAKQQASKDVAKIMEGIEAPVLATLRDTRGGGTNLPHQTQALERIIQLLGGLDGFAAFYVANILAAPPGSIIRERMLNKILAAIQLVSDDARVSKPRGQMSDEELAARIGKYGMKVLNGEVVDGDVRREAS
jgi:hypothetical protein